MLSSLLLGVGTMSSQLIAQREGHAVDFEALGEAVLHRPSWPVDNRPVRPDRARGSRDLEDIEMWRVVTGTAVDPDFTGDGQLDCQDLNLLSAEVIAGTNSFEFDLDGDGTVSVVDMVIWLQAAANANLPPGQGYLGGDFNLDGVVDGLDFVIWNEHKFAPGAQYCDGDGTVDGFIDSADVSIWMSNRFQPF